MKSAIALVPMADPAASVLGMPLIERAVRGLLSAGCVRHVFLCTPTALTLPGEEPEATVVVGDVRAGLATASRILPDIRFALVHEVTRAATPPEVIRAVVAELERGAKAVIPVLPLTDTVKRVDAQGRIAGTRDRSGLRVMQSPLGVPVEVLLAAEDPSPAGLGIPLTTVPGHPQALRIRTAFDVATVTP
ncbi:2-C-methyl-D-erythritol 4-phosphate cytidylyltransferase [Actinocrispum wychmicini]|uniref:2-C-methyl-D-erythritol 4-phosphate cytidylyltransferase n=1 Tax=Actinocrispum wychmicini TaxID=1213861 RepID=A0A4R2JEE7_9PSEU|nr:2-C-methyl-D-erythritol 4-phosphate cytidylyltransferase [Actinocrispum wychmicini]TCO58031.1 2-C-methyl-D-erythritol 4-phosphate cytidylyltransferase [Actinocrispum wychmicini]